MKRAPLRLCLAAAACLLGCAPAAASPAAPDGADAARPSGRATTELENLTAFAHLYGYVRFFHPTDAAADAAWPAIAGHGVGQVRDAASVGELADVLEGLYGPLAPSLQLWTRDQPSPSPGPAPGPRDALVYWQYQGFPGTPISLYRPPYRQVRIGADETTFRTFTEAPAPDARVDDELVPDLRARLPVVVTPAAAASSTAPMLPDHEPDDTDVRQAAVVEVWNVLRHFYPYPEAIDGDWDTILADALGDAADDATTEDTVVTLQRLVHRMRDGHGEAGHRQVPRAATLPFRLELVDERAVVTATSASSPFAVGDVVEAIDGEPVLEAVGRAASQLSGSIQWRRFKAATWVVPSGMAGTDAEITVRRDGRAQQITATFVHDAPVRPVRPAAIHRYDDGVFYVDLTRAKWSDLQARVAELAAAPGVVFDLRGYPNHTHRVLEHLLHEPEDALWMHVPRFVEPGGTPVSFQHIGWHLRPATPRIEGKLGFLVSAAAISYAESMLGYVEAHDLGTVLGATPSAGANGDIVRFDTVGGYFVVFTGMRVTQHDGRPMHVQGFAPDVVVAPTHRGIAAGRDEQLEAALTHVRG